MQSVYTYVCCSHVSCRLLLINATTASAVWLCLLVPAWWHLSAQRPTNYIIHKQSAYIYNAHTPIHTNTHTCALSGDQTSFLRHLLRFCLECFSSLFPSFCMPNMQKALALVNFHAFCECVCVCERLCVCVLAYNDYCRYKCEKSC